MMMIVMLLFVLNFDKSVEFWQDVFTKYSGNQVIFHDSQEIWKIIDVLTIEELDPEDELSREKYLGVIEKRKREILDAFNDLIKNPNNVSSDIHKRILQFYSEKTEIIRAKNRLRFQWGMREKFKKSLERMRPYYFYVVEEIKNCGLPEEIAFLPLVESGYNLYNVSKVGAVGLWQFMPNVARKYGLVINSFIDERQDIFKSTLAACKYLKESYDEFKNWPLAITSYNHGVEGIRNAVKIFGNDYLAIWQNYRGPFFKFASRNFYPSFLAAVRVAKDYLTENPIKEDEIYEFDEYILNDYKPLKTLLKELNLHPADFLKDNPEYLTDALLYNLILKPGTKIKIGKPEKIKFHYVRRGDTYAKLRKIYGNINTSQKLIPGEKIFLENY